MRFLILLITVLLVRFTPLRRGFSPSPAAAWAGFSARFRQRQPGWLALLCLLSPLLVLELAFWLLSDVGSGVFVLALGVLVLLLGIGGADACYTIAKRFEQAWARGDHEAAALIAEQELNVQANDAHEMLEMVRGRLLWIALTGYFVPVLWFLLLGPLGALGYRLLRLFVDRIPVHSQGYAGSLVHAMEWLPARLLAVSFALVGHFDRVLDALRGVWGDWDRSPEALVSTAANAAMAPDAEPESVVPVLASTRDLVVRAALAWAVPVALLALLG